jgi:hypothetical protein
MSAEVLVGTSTGELHERLSAILVIIMMMITTGQDATGINLLGSTGILDR